MAVNKVVNRPAFNYLWVKTGYILGCAECEMKM